MAEGPEDVAEFLRRLDGWEPTLVEEVVDYYLARAGFSCSDARVKKLIAAAAERFVSEVAREALQSARMHGSAGVADRRSRGGAAAAASEEGSAAATEGATLTIEDLSFALRQFGTRHELKRKLTARSDRVKSVDLHPTEPWVLCSLFSGNVYVWNYHTQTLVKTFEASDTPVRAARFVARRQWVVAGSDDMQLRVFNYNTMKKVKQFEAHSDYIRSVAVHPTQSLLLSSSDDMSVKLWDWDRNWQNIMIFEGHTHYVMQVCFNPKDPNTFASASLDRTVKVWGLSSSTPHFTLEGHDKGVNCVDYLGEGDKPYLASGSDDRTVKIWDYQSKTCVATLDGHTHNVTAVAFHPELPLVVTASEDGTVRLWNSATYRPEKLVNNAMERAWTLGCMRGSNSLAIGYDEGAVVVKFGREEPAASMDGAGKVIYARHAEIIASNVRSTTAEAKDGERMTLATKELGRAEVFPRSLRHDPSGRFVAVVGDGEYTIFTALAWRNKTYGQGLDFVWGDASGNYAVRESGGKVKLFANFKEAAVIKPSNFTPEGIYGGTLVGICSNRFLVFYDWEGRLVRRIDVVPKNVVWAENGEYVAISTDSSFFVLRYRAAEVARAMQAGGPQGEEGIEDAFEVLHEVGERVRAGQWVGDCFVYVNSQQKLNYAAGGQVFTVSHLDRRLYLLGYLPRENRIYLIDKQLGIVSYRLHLAVVNYQTAVLRGDAEAAAKILPDVPMEQRERVARFLQSQGKLAEALEISTDEDHRFELALLLSRLDAALEIATAAAASAGTSGTATASADHRWRMLSDAALRSCRFDLAEQCMERANDVAGLLLLHTSTGDSAALLKLAQRTRSMGKHNVAFACYFITRHVAECLDLLCETGRVPEAAFMARTYAPSQVPRIVKLWREELAKVSTKAAESLADPMDFPNLFPDLQLALKAEQLLAEEYSTPVSSAEYAEHKAALSRDIIAEVRAALDQQQESQPQPPEEEEEEEKEKEEQPAEPEPEESPAAEEDQQQ